MYDQKGNVIGPKLKTEAEQLAKKQGLNLVAGDPTKYKHKYPTYLLEEATIEEIQPISGTVDDKEAKDAKKPFKIANVKRMVINGSINDNDLETKAKSIRKWAYNMCEVKVLIRGSEKRQLESVSTNLERKLTDFRILQKIVKAADIKFTVSPDPKKLDYYAEIRSKDKDAGGVDDVDIAAEISSTVDDDELKQLIDEKLKKK